MKLNNKELYELFRQRGVKNLFHANTVATSITFIEQGGLLSRQQIENKNLYQTAQTSDDIDKQFDIFDDIFLDTADLHKHFSRQNHYGPVLFKFKLELILDTELDIWITKDNPIYWESFPRLENKYFHSVEELSEKWNEYEIQRKMFTIRKPRKPILFENLESIILDNPKVKTTHNTCLKSESEKALKYALAGDKHLKEILAWRECGHCFCTDNYQKQVDAPELAKKFLPIDHAEFDN